MVYKHSTFGVIIMTKFRQWLSGFMYGRRGVDNFSRFLIVAALIVILLENFMPGLLRSLFSFVGLAGIIYACMRILSRDIYKREQENARYLKKRAAVLRWFRSVRDRWQQRREYRFFRCPSCHALLRVPRGKGKLLLTCRKCGNRFEKKT